MQTVHKMAHYAPQVDEPASYVGGPPPAYPKGYSTKLHLIRLVAKTCVCMVALIGTFVLLAAYIHYSTSCTCASEINSRFDADPLIAEPQNKHEVKLQIGENLKDHKGKTHMDCLVERREQLLDAFPPKGDQRLQVKGEQTVISCQGNKGKRTRRTPVCDCSCAC